MKYIKKFESNGDKLSDDDVKLLTHIVQFVLSLSYNYTVGHDIKYQSYVSDISFYTKITETSETRILGIELNNYNLIVNPCDGNSERIEKFFETIDGLELVKIEWFIYRFEIKKDVDYIISQMTKEKFDVITQANKFNI